MAILIHLLTTQITSLSATVAQYAFAVSIPVFAVLAAHFYYEPRRDPQSADNSRLFAAALLMAAVFWVVGILAFFAIYSTGVAVAFFVAMGVAATISNLNRP
jgi:hypothetical protein